MKTFALILFLSLPSTFAADVRVNGVPVVPRSDVSDTPYGAGWNGVISKVPNQNQVYQKIQSLILATGGGDVYSGTNNRLSGATTLAGPIIREFDHGKTNLNWSLINAADYATTNSYQVIFSGSQSAGQSVLYRVTNNASSDISILIPESFNVATNAYTTNITIPAGTIAELEWTYTGDRYEIKAEGEEDATLAALTSSGFFTGAAGTSDTNETTITYLGIPDNYTATIDFIAQGAAKTNTHKASFGRTVTAYASGGAITIVGTNAGFTIKSAGATDWGVAFASSGNNLLIEAFGDPLQPLDWTVSGFSKVSTNGRTICSIEADSITGALLPDEGASSPTITDTAYFLASPFRAIGNYKVCGVEIFIKRNGSPTGNFSVAVYSTTGTFPDTLVGVATSAIAKSTVPTTGTWVTLSDMNVTFVAGTTYWIVLRSTTADDASNNLAWYLHYTGGGSNGAVASTDGGTGWGPVYEQASYLFIFHRN